MKVLQINSVCGIGSTGRIATDIYKMLEEQGHECTIAYGRGNAPDGIKSIKISSKIDNYSHVLKTRVHDKHGFGSMNATKKFIIQAKEFDPDIIHLHNLHGYYINIEILFEYLKEANKPIIWTLHDCWPFTGHCTYFDYVGCNKWRTECGKCEQKKEYPTSFLIDNSKRNYAKKKELFTSLGDITIVTPSNWLAELVRASFLGKYPVKVINNGIELGVFRPTESDVRTKYNLENKFIILGVATKWDRRKGYKYFEDISERLETDEIIVLVGVTEEQKKELNKKNIIGITRTNNVKELAAIYSASDVFVNPTLEDNFPTTNLESLGCGTPVITFNTGGSIESIDESCGFVVEKENIRELLNKIKEIKVNGKLKYTNYCVKRANRLYSKVDRFEEYIKLYKGCL